MLIKIIDNLITVLTKIRDRLVSKTSPLSETAAKTADTETQQPTLKKRGRPKLNKPSSEQHYISKKSRKSKALPKAVKEKKAKRDTKRSPQQTIEKAKQVDKLIKDKNMTIAEACKSLGLAPSYYYKIRSKHN